jgi:hypothetical protein
MQLKNRTGLPALLFRTGIDDDRLAAALIARVTYEIVDDELIVADEQSWPLSPAPWETEYGPMDGDQVFYRGGVDLLVLGSVRAPDGVPVSQMNVVVQVGESFQRHLMIFGERRWVRLGRDLVPSVPAPFHEIPLTLENAYGGKDLWDELPVPFPANPEGKGFYLEEENAEGQVLPNIEDPMALIRSWNDRPEPVGMGAPGMGFGPRLQQAVRLDVETGMLEELKPLFFNAAFPGMVVPRVIPGERVRVTGVREDGILDFILPRSGLYMRLRLGNEVLERELQIDQIGIEADHGRAFITYRYPFRYTMVPLQKRECELVLREERVVP